MLTVLFFSLHQEHSQNETSSRSPALSRFCDLLRGGCCKGGRSDRVQKKVSIGARPPASAQYHSWSCGAPAPASGRDQRDWIPCGNCTAPKRPHALSGNIPPPKKKISALAKIIAPRIYLVWLLPCRLALTGCPLPCAPFRWTKWALSRAKRDVKPSGALRGLGAAADVQLLIRTQDVKEDPRVSHPR